MTKPWSFAPKVFGSFPSRQELTPEQQAAVDSAAQDALDGRPLTDQISSGSNRSTGTRRKSAPNQNSAANIFALLPEPSSESLPPSLETLNASQGSRFSTSGQSIPEAFSINSFRSEMLENEVLPSHTYLVTFAPFRDMGTGENAALTSFVTNKRNTLMMRCENVVLPAPSLIEEENIRRYGYGPVEKVPYGVQFSDVTMTWVVDKNSEIVDFFHQWMNTIVMHDSPNTLMAPNFARPGLQDYNPFEVGYKDSYANPTVRIYVYNRQNETTTTYEMYDVFPMNIQSMNLSWADENQVQKLTVTFAYTNMRVQAPRKTPVPQLNFLGEGRDVNYFSRSTSEQQFINDFAESPLSERFTRTMNSSNPTIKDPQDFSDVAAAPPTPQPIVRNLNVT
jgi:hypothetical protein